MRRYQCAVILPWCPHCVSCPAVSCRLSGSVRDVVRLWEWGLAWILHSSSHTSWTHRAGEMMINIILHTAPSHHHWPGHYRPQLVITGRGGRVLGDCRVTSCSSLCRSRPASWQYNQSSIGSQLVVWCLQLVVVTLLQSLHNWAALRYFLFNKIERAT